MSRARFLLVPLLAFVLVVGFAGVATAQDPFADDFDLFDESDFGFDDSEFDSEVAPVPVKAKVAAKPPAKADKAKLDAKVEKAKTASKASVIDKVGKRNEKPKDKVDKNAGKAKKCAADAGAAKSCADKVATKAKGKADSPASKVEKKVTKTKEKAPAPPAKTAKSKAPAEKAAKSAKK